MPWPGLQSGQWWETASSQLDLIIFLPSKSILWKVFWSICDSWKWNLTGFLIGLIIYLTILKFGFLLVDSAVIRSNGNFITAAMLWYLWNVNVNLININVLSETVIILVGLNVKCYPLSLQVQQGVWALFGYPNPQKSPLRTSKTVCEEFLKMWISIITLNFFYSV